MSSFLRDLRLAARALRRAPLFTSAAVLTLALGIGANAAVFGVVRGLLLRPLPYAQPDELVVVWGDHVEIGHETASLPDFRDWRAGSTSFASLAAVAQAPALLTGGGEAERVDGVRMTGDALATLGRAPRLGRTFTADEQRANGAPVVMISEQLWRRRFAADPAIVGRSIAVNGQQQTIVGVAPNDLPLLSPPDVFFPLALDDQEYSRRADFLGVVGRLKPGVAVETAERELQALMARLAIEYPDTNTGWSVDVVPLHEEIVGELRPALLAFTGAVALVLLIACANVANLFLARAAAREHELGVRVTLGATRGRLVQQLLAESVLLAAAGAVLGLALAAAALGALRGASSIDVPRVDAIALDGLVVAFTVGLAALSAVLFGLAPMLRIARGFVRPGLASARGVAGGTGVARTRAALVLGEVALALVLLVGAGLLVRSFDQLQRVEPGFEANGLLTARVTLPGAEMMDSTRVTTFWSDVLDRLTTAPGLRGAAYVSTPPMGGAGYWSFALEGAPPAAAGEVRDVQPMIVSRDYFATMRIPVVQGRAFATSDNQTAGRVALVNQEFVRRHGGEQAVLGRRLTFGDAGDPDATWYTIVGVVGDVVQEGLAEGTYPQVYRSLDQFRPRGGHLVVRAGGDPLALTPTLRAAVATADANVAVTEVRTMVERMATTVARPRVSAALLAGFAGVALVLAAIGIYGVTAYTTALRTRELGIRLALGGTPRGVLALVVRQGMLPVLVGMGIGAVGALLAGRVLAQFLFGVGAADVLTFVATAGVLGGIALLACWFPARRALGLAPASLLRHD